MQEVFVENVIIRKFDRPDEVRMFEKGKFELVSVGGMNIGRATYEPGWKWSKHVGPTTGAKTCLVAHVGQVLSGRCMVQMSDGKEYELRAGDFFYVAPGHDSWVLGNEPYVSLHFLGTEAYAKK